MEILEIIASENPKSRVSLEIEQVDLPGDLITPVGAYLKLRALGAKFLLESAEDPKSLGRYTFIGFDPLLSLRIEEDRTTITSRGNTLAIPHTVENGPFEALKRILNRFQIPKRSIDSPLLGGVVGFISYEMVRFIEPRLQGKLPPSPWPYGLFYFVDTLLVFDHFTRRIKIVRLKHEGGSLNSGRKPISFDQIKNAIGNSPLELPISGGPSGNGYRANFTVDQFKEITEKSQKHIFKGDIFQAVLSLREEHKSTVDGFQAYRALRMLNPSPYMYYLDFDGLELIGSSPEALVKLKGRQASIRPIAGTRRRGASEEEDRRMADELLRDDKERAEHVMLVDLARNDLGRVCKYSTIEVPMMMQLEHYSHVMHMTSNVTGTLRDDLDQFGLFRSAFPAGTVSGAPKIRAMEIIADLEQTYRGPYAGSVGYFSLSGDMDMCITIRTIIKQRDLLHFQAGAGIVADSIPELEYLETRNKIAALKEAVRIAEEGEL